MNQSLATAAKNALRAPGFATRKGLCQMFARQCIESVYGSKYAAYRAASAKGAALLWLKSPYGFAVSHLPEHGGLEAGDLCYKTLGSGGYGHVGIYIGGGQIAENSSYHAKGADTDARGVRSVEQFGAFQVVVRLPEVKVIPIETAPAVEAKLPPVPTYTLNGATLDGATLQNGRLMAPVRVVTDALGYTLQAGEGGALKARREAA